MINMESLKRALAPISKIGDQELTIEVNGTNIVLRPLTDYEEVAAQKSAQVAIEDGSTGAAALADYFARTRLAFLTSAIVQIGDLDLRNVEYIEIGETLKDGTPIKKPKKDALKEILSTWGRPVLFRLFIKYGELVETVQIDTEKKIKYEPVDFDKEIERLQERIQELTAKKKKVEDNLDTTGKNIKDMIRLTEKEIELQSSIPLEASEPPSPQVVTPLLEVALEKEKSSRKEEARKEFTPRTRVPPHMQAAVDSEEVYKMPVSTVPPNVKNPKEAKLEVNSTAGTTNPHFKR
jgi:hypothetical protein